MIRNIEIDGDKIQFINHFKNTRSGFAHYTEFIYNDFPLVKTSCHYLNRTWENYAYQSVMLKAVSIAMDECRERCKRNFKALNGYQKLTAKRAAEFEELLNKSEEYRKFIKIRDVIRGRVW